MTRITQRTLGTLAPEEKPRFVRDDELKGFGIKVNPSGKASYFVEARVRRGRTVRKNVGDVDLLGLDDARNEARALLLDLKRGIDVGKRAPPAPHEPNTLAELINRYLTERTQLKQSTREHYRALMNRCCSHLMDRNVSEITPIDVGQVYVEVTERASPSYARIVLRTLRAILNSAEISSNPVTLFFRRSGISSASTVRTRYLSGHEAAQIIEISRDPATLEPNAFGELLCIYLLTGCRKNEILQLTKSDYSESDGTLTIRNTKNNRPHVIPTEGMIGAIIERRLAEDHDRLWPYSDSTFRTKLTKAKAYLQFANDWTTHDLRRTFAEHSHLIGVDQNVIAACLNHTPVGVTATAYLGGGLAKREMLRDVYQKLQRQYIWYVYPTIPVTFIKRLDDLQASENPQGR